MSGDKAKTINYLSLQKQISYELNKLIKSGILYEDEAMSMANNILFSVMSNTDNYLCSSSEIDSIIIKFITTNGPYAGLDSSYFGLIENILNKETDSPLDKLCDRNSMNSKEREIIWLF